MADNELTVEEINELWMYAQNGRLSSMTDVSVNVERLSILCDMARRYATEMPRLQTELDAEKTKVTKLCDMACEKGKVVLAIERIYWTEGLSAKVRLERIRNIFDKDLKSPDPHGG